MEEEPGASSGSRALMDKALAPVRLENVITAQTDLILLLYYLAGSGSDLFHLEVLTVEDVTILRHGLASCCFARGA